MQIVIELSELDYEVIKRRGSGAPAYIDRAILEGIVLPKGHRDLKDMGNLKYVFDLTRTDYIYSGEDIRRAIESMTTIVPSDTEERE